MAGSGGVHGRGASSGSLETSGANSKGGVRRDV